MTEQTDRALVAGRSLVGPSIIYALEITHDDLTQPIRVVADTVRHTVEANEYIPLAFRAEIPQDKEGEIRQARLRVDNVGGELMHWINVSKGGRGAMMRAMRLIPPEGR